MTASAKVAVCGTNAKSMKSDNKYKRRDNEKFEH